MARQLGISKVVRGSFVVQGEIIRIDAGIWDTVTGVNQGSESVQGKVDAFFDLEKELVMKILRRLPVEVSVEEGQSIEEETNTSVNAYKLLLEAEGVSRQPTPAAQPTRSPRARGVSRGPQSMWRPPVTARSNAAVPGRSLAHGVQAWFVRAAFAAEPAPDAKAEVLQSLEEYRHALEQKNLDRVAHLYQAFSERQREALRAYLANAVNLEVEIVDIQVELHGGRVAVSFRRRDKFIDHATGKPTRLEVRLTKIFVREGGKWMIAAGA
jgi:hypothetical protein